MIKRRGERKKDEASREFAGIVGNMWKIIVELLVLPVKLFVWIFRVVVFFVHDVIWANLKNVKGEYCVVFTKVRGVEKKFENKVKRKASGVGGKIGHMEHDFVEEIKEGSVVIWRSLVSVVMLPVQGAVLLVKDGALFVSNVVKAIWRGLFYIAGKLMYLIGLVCGAGIWLLKGGVGDVRKMPATVVLSKVLSFSAILSVQLVMWIGEGVQYVWWGVYYRVKRLFLWSGYVWASVLHAGYSLLAIFVAVFGKGLLILSNMVEKCVVLLLMLPGIPVAKFFQVLGTTSNIVVSSLETVGWRCRAVARRFYVFILLSGGVAMRIRGLYGLRGRGWSKNISVSNIVITHEEIPKRVIVPKKKQVLKKEEKLDRLAEKLDARLGELGTGVNWSRVRPAVELVGSKRVKDVRVSAAARMSKRLRKLEKARKSDIVWNKCLAELDETMSNLDKGLKWQRSRPRISGVENREGARRSDSRKLDAVRANVAKKLESWDDYLDRIDGQLMAMGRSNEVVEWKRRGFWGGLREKLLKK